MDSAREPAARRWQHDDRGECAFERSGGGSSTGSLTNLGSTGCEVDADGLDTGDAGAQTAQTRPSIATRMASGVRAVTRSAGATARRAGCSVSSERMAVKVITRRW